MITALMEALFFLWQAPMPPPPTAHWSIQIEPARCVLERTDGDGGHLLSIDTTPGSDTYRLTMVVDGVNAPTALRPASLTFAPSQKMATGLAKSVELPGKVKVATMQGLPASVLDDLSGASTLTLKIGGSVSGSVSVSDSAKAVAALRTCSADQLIDWGADPAQFTPAGTLPIALTPRDDWLPAGEFLKLAGQTRRATVSDDFRLLVAPDGTIVECHATAEITEPALEARVCAAVADRRLFDPARDSGGKAVIGAATFKVVLVRQPS